MHEKERVIEFMHGYLQYQAKQYNAKDFNKFFLNKRLTSDTHLQKHLNILRKEFKLSYKQINSRSYSINYEKLHITLVLFSKRFWILLTIYTLVCKKKWHRVQKKWHLLQKKMSPVAKKWHPLQKNDTPRIK